MTTRFPADLPYDDTLPLITVGDLVNQGKTAEAVSFLEANQKACANALGAVGYWRDKYVPAAAVTLEPPLKASETRSITGGQPGTLYTIQLEAGGPASVEISGSPLVTFGVGAKGVLKTEGRWTQGAGTAAPLPTVAGEWLTWSYDAPQGGQTMRPQVLAV